MTLKTFQLTKDGIDELKNELDALIKQRPEMAEKIKIAREYGDLSENAEYQTAREEQTKAESRISEIEEILANAELIKKPKSDGRVGLGSFVKLKSASGARELQIVGSVEADPIEGKISDESPIGQALLGKSVGESVEIATASEMSTYKIVSVS